MSSSTIVPEKLMVFISISTGVEFQELQHFSTHKTTGSNGSDLEEILVMRLIAFSLVDFLGWRLVMDRRFKLITRIPSRCEPLDPVIL